MAEAVDEAKVESLGFSDKCCLGQKNRILWVVKDKYPHAFHKRTKDGKVIFLDRAQGFLTVANNAGSLGVQPAECSKHLQFLHDFCFTVLDPRDVPEGRFIRICDVGEVNLWSLGPATLTFLIQMLAPVPPSYQDRVEKVFIVNANSVTSVFVGLCSQVFSKDFMEKIAVYTSSEKERLFKDLLEVVDAESLPVEFGGTCECAGEGGCWRNAPEEVEFWKQMSESTPEEDRLAVPARQ